MSIKKRKVFYISGFDPRGASYYHRLYKQEAKKYSALSNTNINVSERKNTSNHEAEWRITNDTTQTDYSFLKWDDIVRDNWPKGFFTLLKKSVCTYANYITKLDWNKVLSLSKSPVVTLFYPLLIIFILYILSSALYSLITLFTNDYGIVSWILNSALVIALVYGSGKAFQAIKAPWLLRLYIFTDKTVNHDKQIFLKRAKDFSNIIAKTKNYEEILLIAHSHGSSFLPAIINSLNNDLSKKIKVISLGHCIPLVSLRKEADWYKEELISASQKTFDWLDIGAPADGTCYAFTGPYKGAIEEADIKTNLITTSPRFHKSINEKSYKQLKWNKFEFHFLYLTSPDILGYYNYFELTAGKLSFSEFIKKYISRKNA